jgi:predicted ribosome quality control (RQC) complex YloA/Tae2 family protein
MAADRLVGRRVTGLSKPPGDRTVILAFEGGEPGEAGPRLVLEAFPPGRLLLLGPGGEIRALTGPSAARLRVGHRYETTSRKAGGGLLAAGETGEPSPDLEAVVREEARTGRDPRPALCRAIPGLSRALAGILLRAATEGRGLHDLLDRIREALARPPVPSLVVGVPPDPSDLAALARKAPTAWPALLEAGLPAEGRESYATASEAADRLGDLLETSARFYTRCRALARTLKGECRRAERALRSLEREAGSDTNAATLRRWAEALLAVGSEAPREARGFRVPDPYDPAGSDLLVPWEGGEDAIGAAEACFRRARRMERTVTARARRRVELESRIDRLSELQAGIAAVHTFEALEELEARVRAAGIAAGLRPLRTRGGQPARHPAARIFVSSDGLEILVGRGGRENDHLTFRVAGPDDFWLHAVGAPGAHVIVRNPGGLRQLPPATLREAAALAAHYSRLSGAAAADVQVTRRRLVRRARNAPPGTVLVKRSTTVRASTRHPFPEAPAAR